MEIIRGIVLNHEEAKRLHKRYRASDFKLKSYLWVVAGSGLQQVEILDMSVKGFLIKSPVALEKNQELSMIFDVFDIGKVFYIKAVIRNVSLVGYGVEIVDFGVTPQEYGSLVDAWIGINTINR